MQRAPMYAPYHKRDIAECGMAGAAASAYVSERPHLDPSGWESPCALAENTCQQPAREVKGVFLYSPSALRLQETRVDGKGDSSQPPTIAPDYKWIRQQRPVHPK